MTCEDLNAVLVDLVDGRLDPATERAAERHLEACDRCRALLSDLRTIHAAAFTLDRREPAPTTWPAIAARVAAEPVPRARVLRMPSTRGAWAMWLGAAAALVVATFVGVWPFLHGNPAPARDGGSETAAAPEVTVESITAEFEAAEQHYQKAITDLETIARKETGELDPEVAAVLQKNLTVIDQAISESRAALQSQPSSVNAQDGLFDALRSKVALLQQTVELINEMRKGNQAEAGRKFQTLAQ
jgi:anti-sigma factor ChrR (cupin superfamily)